MCLLAGSHILLAQGKSKEYLETWLDPHRPLTPETTNYEKTPVVVSGLDLTRLPAYIQDHLNYPQAAQENGIEGEVTAQVVINKFGYIKSVKILEGIHIACDQAVVRMFLEMPRWTPFIQQGKPTTKTLTVRVRFKMV